MVNSMILEIHRYKNIVQIIDIKSERTIFCHNCKRNINLNNGEASIHCGIEHINNTFKKIKNAIKNFGK